MSSKKTKSTPVEVKTSFPFVDALWTNTWALADDGRGELHKQTTALISFVDGALQSATKLVGNLSDRADSLGQLGIKSADQSGRLLAVAAVGKSQLLFSSYKSSASQLVLSTQNSARNVANRASATATAILAPASKAA